ncbi:MAG: disulfide bond formation protein B [Candidatus Nanohalobium sp.]
MNLIVEAYSIATLLMLLFIISAISGSILYRYGYLRKWKEIEELFQEYWKELSLLIAILATLGSLYLSNIEYMLVFRNGFLEIVKRPLTGGSRVWTPCRLCWFQRILMYPLVLLFGVSWLLDTDVAEYAVPMATIGGGIAAYHYMIQRIEQFHSAGCSIMQVSCDTEYTFYMGIVTIPFMAFTAFLGILLLNWKFGDSEL